MNHLRPMRRASAACGALLTASLAAFAYGTLLSDHGLLALLCPAFREADPDLLRPWRFCFLFAFLLVNLVIDIRDAKRRQLGWHEVQWTFYMSSCSIGLLSGLVL